MLSFVLLSMGGFMLVAHIAAVTALSYRTKMLSPVINIVGWIAALLFLVSTLAVASTSSVFAVCGLIGFLVWSLWIVLISIDMWRRAAAPAAAAVTS